MSNTPAASKPLPKFIPTLTEVVDAPQRLVDVPLDEPGELAPATAVELPMAVPVVVPIQRPPVDGNEIVQRVIQRLDGPLQAEMESVLVELVADHFRKLEPLLQDELARVLRRRVEDALVEEVLRASKP
jgi:hypothetical protein